MIDPLKFVKCLKKFGIEFVTGVPDSLLKSLDSSFEKIYKKKHIISTNEGSAIAFSIGNYLSTKKPNLVYMQNSGLGNCINPINSLADPKVYGIPLILLIGWRGEIKKNSQLQDEPQHKKQGLITLDQLKIMNIPYKIIDKNTNNYLSLVKNIKNLSIKRSGPVAIVVRKDTFENKNFSLTKFEKNKISRETAISTIIDSIPKNTIVVSTTGMISRELYELRIKKKQKTDKDFLIIGGMGHANQVAAGIASQKTNRNIVCLDGDGSVLMHMGSLALNSKLNNFTHIILNNGAHDSVGGQPTKGREVNFVKIAKACGYKSAIELNKIVEIEKILKKEVNKKRSSMIVINCKKGNRKNLGRPKLTPREMKNKFIKSLIK